MGALVGTGQTQATPALLDSLLGLQEPDGGIACNGHRRDKHGGMVDAETSLQFAQMRLERAVLNVKDVIIDGGAVGELQFRDFITRIVIALNTMAEALHRGAGQEHVAELLWGFGEQLGINVDGARG